MVEIDWTVTGEEFFERRLRQISRRARTMEPVLAKIGEQWIAWIEEQFESQGVRFLGHKWKKLALATIKRRGSSQPILIEHADLLLAVTDPGNVRVTPDRVTLDVDGEQARIGGFHQTGTDPRSGFTFTGVSRPGMPARPIIEWGERDRRQMYADIREWLFEETGQWVR